MQYLDDTYIKNIFVIYLNFKCNWASCFFLFLAILTSRHIMMKLQNTEEKKKCIKAAKEERGGAPKSAALGCS